MALALLLPRVVNVLFRYGVRSSPSGSSTNLAALDGERDKSEKEKDRGDGVGARSLDLSELIRQRFAGLYALLVPGALAEAKERLKSERETSDREEKAERASKTKVLDTGMPLLAAPFLCSFILHGYD